MIKIYSKMKTFFLMIIVPTLVGCGGGGGGGGSDAPPAPGIRYISSDTVDANDILENIKITNLPSWGSDTQQHQNFNLKRWDYETTLIPVKHKDVPLVIKSMDEIEDRLGFTIFDRDSLSNVADGSVTAGIIISIGTANYANINGGPAIGGERQCGLASAGIPSLENPDNAYFPNFVYDENGVVNAKLYIHLGSTFHPSGIDCYKGSTDLTIHEFGHALGVLRHFTGGFNGNSRYAYTDPDGTNVLYAETPNDNFWNVLRNIYNNNINETAENLTITQYY